MARNYSAAIAALNTLQTNFATIKMLSRSRKSLNAYAIPEMIEWWRKLGYEINKLSSLNAIHIAGTKGKGSTSAMVNAILMQYQTSTSHPEKSRLRKIGLYTSPHLRFVRERIQIDGEPLSEPAFAKYFFEVWDRFEGAAKANNKPEASQGDIRPAYFRYLTLMAFHAYLQEGSDVSIIECGIGGEYDSTNIIPTALATGITSLGIDHTEVLGDTIEDIAWHKAGIFKPGVPAFSVPQPPSAMAQLHTRAQEIKCPLTVVELHPALAHINLGLNAEFQKINASLAIALAAECLRSKGILTAEDVAAIQNGSLPSQFKLGLEQVKWPGRCEIRPEKAVTWYIDGGHTLESIREAGLWFSSHVPTSSSSQDAKNHPQRRILIFNQQTRDASALARALYQQLSSVLGEQSPFTHIIFCTNTTFQNTGSRAELLSLKVNDADIKALKVQKALADTWRELDPRASVEVVTTIEEAVAMARDAAAKDRTEGDDTAALVTGSLHLVGGFIDVLETEGPRGP